MSRTLPDRLRQLDTDLDDLRVLPAATVRARGRRRAHRRLVGAVAAVAAAAGTTGVMMILVRPEQPPVTTAGPSAPACTLALPADPAQVRVRVIDGGAPAGPADAVAGLRDRRLTVLTGTPAKTTDATAMRYGPEAVGAASLLRAYLPGEVIMSFDARRAGDTIDLTIGSDFTRLASPTEVNQALVAAGEPTAPPGCAPSPGK
jgi:LytR cell envelope-related transcriptional attenuator